MEQSWTALESIASLDSAFVVHGDSTSLFAKFSEDLEPFDLASSLLIEDMSTSTSASLRDLEIDGELGEATISLSVLKPWFDDIDEPFRGILPPFTFSTSFFLGDMGGIEWIEVESGAAWITVTNKLPVAIFDPALPREGRILRLLAEEDQRVLSEYVVPKEVGPGEEFEAFFDIGGQVIPGRLALEITGSSPGSVGIITIDPLAPITFDARTSETIVVSALQGYSEPISGTLETFVDLESNLGLIGAEVSSGTLDIQIDNDFPLSVSFVIEIPGLEIGGVPLSLETTAPGQTIVDIPIDLAGAILSTGDALVRVYAETEDRSEEPITLTQADALTISAAFNSLSFSEVTGAFPDPMKIATGPIETGLSEFPGNIHPVAPRGFIIFTDPPGFDCSVDFVVQSTGDGDGLRVSGALGGNHDSLAIDPGELAAFLSSNPDVVELSGTVSIDGVATIRADDSIAARIDITLPFQFDISAGSYHLDPGVMEIDPETSEMLLENIHGASLVSIIESDFPVGLSVDLRAMPTSSIVPPDSIGAEETLATIALPAPPLDDDGHAIESVLQNVRIDLDRAQIERLFGDSHLATAAILSVSDAGIVSVYGDDRIQIRSHLEFTTIVGGE